MPGCPHSLFCAQFFYPNSSTSGKTNSSLRPIISHLAVEQDRIKVTEAKASDFSISVICNLTSAFLCDPSYVTNDSDLGGVTGELFSNSLTLPPYFHFPISSHNCVSSNSCNIPLLPLYWI